MRSRLEARWAAFFDLIGWSWVYEPYDTGDWIPDFLVQGTSPFLVEVGPCVLDSEYSAKAAKPLAAYLPIPAYCERIAHETCRHGDDFVVRIEPERLTLVVGVSPLWAASQWLGREAAGLITDNGDGGTGPVGWVVCRDCKAIAVSNLYYTNYPCGHAPHDDTFQLPGQEVVNTWNAAGAKTQWQPWSQRRRAR